MAYTEKDLDAFVRGDDWILKLNITSDGVPLDITGYSYWLTLKSDIKANDDVAELQVQISPTVENAPNGIIYIKASSTLTSTLSPGSYFYDIQQVNLAGEVQTLMMGKVKVVRDVTRTTAV